MSLLTCIYIIIYKKETLPKNTEPDSNQPSRSNDQFIGNSRTCTMTSEGCDQLNQ